MPSKVTIQNGQFQDAAGNFITGTLTLQLSQDAVVTGTGTVAPTTVSIVVTAGQAVATPIWGNDNLSPSGTVYTARLFDTSGSTVWGPENWSITGAGPVELNTLVPATNSVSYSGAVLLTPTGSQTITTGTLTAPNFSTAGAVTSATLSVSGAGSVSGTLTAPTILTKNINAIRYADQFTGLDAFTQINAAIADLPSTGGIVDARGFGAATYAVSTQLVVGSSTKPVLLLLNKDTEFDISYTGGGDCIQLWNKSAIVGAANAYASNSTFALTSSANCSRVLGTYPQGSGASITYLQGVTFKGASGATVSQCMVELWNPTDNTTVDHVLVWNPFGVGFKISNNGAGGVGPISLNYLSVNGNGNAGAQPVLVQYNSGGVMGGITFFGGSFTHPGTGGLALIDLEGGAASAIEGVQLIGVQFESSNATDIGLLINNAREVLVAGAIFTKATNAGADCIKVTQTTGSSLNCIFENVVNYNSWTHTINDTVNSYTDANSRVNSYKMAPDTSIIETWAGAFGTTGQIAQMTTSGLSAKTLVATAATPTTSGTQIGFGTTTGFGNGAAGTAVTTTLKSTGTGPTTPQTVVKYMQVNIGGTAYWVPLVQ